MQNGFPVRAAMNSIVPITRFNRGEASRIFEEVKLSGTKMVLKNNIPECFLVSPDQYVQIMDMLEDYQLLLEAQERMAASSGKTYREADVMEELGITEDDLAGSDEVEFE